MLQQFTIKAIGGAVVAQGEAETLRQFVEELVRKRQSLGGTNLARACLARAALE